MKVPRPRVSVVIPVRNEQDSLCTLVDSLRSVLGSSYELILVDDGSTDGSVQLLKDYSFINLIKLENNLGKGVAIRTGIQNAKYNKIVITDGDMELNPKEIKSLMILDKTGGIECVFGTRYKHINPFKTIWDFGNFFLTGLFNLMHENHLTDALCCAKSFYKGCINPEDISSQGFDIDVELAAKLTKNLTEIRTVYLSYYRRSKEEGKKLHFVDGWSIFKRILNTR